jgi:uncharacterized coiled-coil protein SlyX
MSESEEGEQRESSNLLRGGYEAAEEERRSLEEEERNAYTTTQEEERQPELVKQQKKEDETRGKRRRSSTNAVIGAATSAWQVTLFDLDKQLNRQRMLMERVADDVKHLRKQFNQVQRDLAKFEKRMGKMKTTKTISSTTKRARRRG